MRSDGVNGLREINHNLEKRRNIFELLAPLWHQACLGALDEVVGRNGRQNRGPWSPKGFRPRSPLPGLPGLSKWVPGPLTVFGGAENEFEVCFSKFGLGIFPPFARLNFELSLKVLNYLSRWHVSSSKSGLTGS